MSESTAAVAVGSARARSEEEDYVGVVADPLREAHAYVLGLGCSRSRRERPAKRGKYGDSQVVEGYDRARS